METVNSSGFGPPCEPQDSDTASAACKPIKKSGPESKVTVALVKRVSKRIARGIPIRLALSGEPVTQSAYQRHLRRHPDLKAIQEGAKIKFLDKAFDMILSRPGPMLRWLLERRHSDLFATAREEAPGPTVAPRSQTQTIAGVPQEAQRNAPKMFEENRPFVMSEEYIRMLQEDAKKL